ELVSELDQVVRRSLLEARDDDQGVYVLGPRATALRLEERRRVDHDECERRLAQLVEQDLKRIRGYERRRRGLACAQDGEAAGPAPGRSRSGRLDDHSGGRLGVPVPGRGEDLCQARRALHPEELLERWPPEVGIDDERGLPGLRERAAEPGRDLHLALVVQRAGHEQDLLALAGKLSLDDGSQHVEGLTLRYGAGRAAACFRDLGQDRDAAQALEIPSLSHARRD